MVQCHSFPTTCPTFFKCADLKCQAHTLHSTVLSVMIAVIYHIGIDKYFENNVVLASPWGGYHSKH